MKQANTSRQGFTLTELLVAAALGVLVLAAVMAALAGGLRVWDRARGGTSPALEAALAFEWLQRDFHNTAATRLGVFEGEADRVRLPVLVSSTGMPPSRVLWGVTYALGGEGGALERSAVRWPVGGEPADGEALAAGVESVRFSYRNGAEGEWLTSWTGRTNRPAAVEVVLRFMPDRGGLEIRRTMFIPGA